MRVALAALVVCAGQLVATAHAGGTRPDARRIAAVRFQRGRVLYQKGAYTKALAAFRDGFERYPLRGFLVNIGQCYRQLHRYDEAARAFQEFLDSPDAPKGMRREVEEALAEVEAARPAPELPLKRPVDKPTPAAAAIVTAPPPAHAESELPPGVRTDVVIADAPPRHTRRWVWAVVGVGSVLVAGAIATGVVLGTRAAAPGAGSLGLIDTRSK